MKKIVLTVAFVGGLAVCAALAQAPVLPPVEQDVRQQEPAKSNSTVNQLNQRLQMAASQQFASAADYQIGPEDLLDISVFEQPELSRSVRVSASGEISLPFIDAAVAAGGMTPRQLEVKLTELWRKYLKDPQVTVFVREYRASPISIIGPVRQPGVHYIQTRRTLLEVLALAGGFTGSPGSKILITRRTPGSGPNGAPGETTIEVAVKSLLQDSDSKSNVAIMPGDVIRVLGPGVFYIAGSVNRTGGFPLTEYDSVSVMQALALAGGTTRTASRKNASIIHIEENGKRSERPVDLGRVLKGKDPDTQLGPNDILFVPGSVGKESALRAIEASIGLGTGWVLYRR